MLLSCVVIFCFFFFKQKTAYEMRISDWSSDVCSSDLWPDRRAGALDGGRPGGLLLAPLLPGGVLQVGDEGLFQGLDTARRNQGSRRIAGQHLAGEIGRAPCRERVCQCV